MEMEVPIDAKNEVRPRPRRRWLRRVVRFVSVLLILAVVAVLFWLRGALYNRFVRFPKEEAAWKALRAQRQAVPDDAGWTEYRGILHSHSFHSHDSEVPFEEILRVLKSAGIDFICLSDHCVDDRADFDLQWRGLHDGKLFIPGFEMKEGIMPFGVSAGVVLSNGPRAQSSHSRLRTMADFCSTRTRREPRDWDRPELVGMEIYNIHVDFKRVGAACVACCRIFWSTSGAIRNKSSMPSRNGRWISFAVGTS